MPRELAPNEYCELGRAFYAESNYKKALEAFTKAFNAGKKHDIKFLDMRASVYEKMNDFNAALKDGRRMVELEREDPRGYLRTARVLQRQEKAELALHVYNLGLRRSSKDHHSSANFALLQKLQSELSRQLSPPRSIDPLTVFPAEIVDVIMSHLNFRQQVNCIRVSKQWKKYLDSQESLWTNLDLSMAKKTVRPTFVRACIYRSNMHLKTAKFNRFRDDKMLWKLARSCKEIESLQFLGSELSGLSISEPARMCQNLRELVVGSGITMTMDTLRPILQGAARLAIIDIAKFRPHKTREVTWDVNMPYLRKLKLCGGGHFTSWVIMDTPSLARSAPNLIELSILELHLDTAQDFTSFTQLEGLYISPVINWSLLPSSLRRLIVGHPYYPPSNGAADANLPHLEELSIDNIGPIHRDDTWLWDFLSRVENGIGTIDPTWTNLKKFGIGLTIDGNDLDIVCRYLGHPRLHQVEDLSIVHLYMGMRECTEYLLERLPDLFPHLRRLSIPNSKVTGADLRPLIEKLACPENASTADTLGDTEPTITQGAQSQRRLGISYLNLDGCAEISSDAIEWIRQRGIEVSHIMPKY